MAKLVSDAPKKVGRPSALSWKRTDAATVGRLEDLFDAVESGALQPREATQRAIELLTDDEELPEGLRDELEASVYRITRDPQQIELGLSGEVVELEQRAKSSQPPREKHRARAVKAVVPARKLRVEIRKSSKNSKPTLVIIEN